jgi:hypothetical protein
MRRVVVTGIGAITPIGNTAIEFWNGILSGKCGIDRITLFDTTEFKAKLAGEVKNYNPDDYFDKKASKRLDRYSQFAIIAAEEAFSDSKIDINNIDAERFGIIVGSGIGGLATIEEQANQTYTQYANKLAKDLKLENKETLIREVLPDLRTLKRNDDALKAVLEYITPKNKDKWAKELTQNISFGSPYAPFIGKSLYVYSMPTHCGTLVIGGTHVGDSDLVAQLVAHCTLRTSKGGHFLYSCPDQGCPRPR